MTNLYLARHGETDWNKFDRKIGNVDIKLNEMGIQQALNLAEKLKSIDIDKIYSSPLSRALQTAKIIKNIHPKSPEITMLEALKEISLGILQGKTTKEIEKFLPGFDVMNDQHRKMLNIEPIKKSVKEWKNLLPFFINRSKDKILMISHKRKIMVILLAMGLTLSDLDQFSFKTGTIIKAEVIISANHPQIEYLEEV